MSLHAQAIPNDQRDQHEFTIRGLQPTERVTASSNGVALPVTRRDDEAVFNVPNEEGRWFDVSVHNTADNKPIGHANYNVHAGHVYSSGDETGVCRGMN